MKIPPIAEALAKVIGLILGKPLVLRINNNPAEGGISRFSQ